MFLHDIFLICSIFEIACLHSIFEIDQFYCLTTHCFGSNRADMGLPVLRFYSAEDKLNCIVIIIDKLTSLSNCASLICNQIFQSFSKVSIYIVR